MSRGKPAVVKAVAMTAPGKLEIRGYPYPRLDRDSAILKVEMAGLSGTDKHIFRGEASSIRGKSIFPWQWRSEVQEDFARRTDWMKDPQP